MEFTRDCARTIAEWWGNHIDSITHHDNGDLSFESFFAGLMADSLNESVTESQREHFVEILTDKLMNAYAEEGHINSFYLESDYGPSEFLYNAAIEAGISPNNFPWKTSMNVDDYDGETKVRVSYGYRAPWKTIWPIEENE